MTPALLELQKQSQWVCWRYIEREGKRTKPPVNPVTGELASSTDPATWSAYEQAVTAAQRFGNDGGVGFVVTTDDEYVGIDLDHVMDDGGAVLPWAQAIVTRLNSYTEITPSGRGLRIWLKGTLPPGGRRVGDIEIYADGRYFTITGKHLAGTPGAIEDRTAELAVLHAELFPPQEARTSVAPRPAAPMDLDDAELIEKASSSAHCERFRRLWEGDTSDYGEDESRADLALCSHLYFWARADRFRMDRLFRQSGLMREKWDNRRGDRTYGERTLDVVLQNGGEIYEPRMARISVGDNVTSGGEEAAGALDWESPIPLGGMGDLPIFPANSLPLWLQEFVQTVSEATQTPIDLTAMLALSCCALSIAKHYEVCVQPGYCEPLNLWTLTVTRPGTRSTQVFRDCKQPIEEYECREAQREAPEIAAAKMRYEITEKRAARARDIASKCDSAVDRLSKEGEAVSLAAELEALKVPSPIRLLADDVSQEKLAGLMAAQGGRIAILSPEGGVFGLISGRYSANGEPNMDVYLKAHAGDTIRVDRIGRPSEFIRDPALTLGLRVQPDVIQSLADHRGFRGRGLLGRFIYGLPRDMLGSRKIHPRPVPRIVREAYRSRLIAMLSLPSDTDENGNAVPYRLALSPDAAAVLDEFAGWIEPQLRATGALGAMTDWAGKLVGAVARIAGILHVAERAGDPQPWAAPISAATVISAVRIGHYAIPHAKAAFWQMRADPVVGEALHILEWIGRKVTPGEPNIGNIGNKVLRESFLSSSSSSESTVEITKRDLWRGAMGRHDRVEDIEPALQLLVDHGYLREKPLDGPRGRGRPPVIFLVNPLGLYCQYCQNPSEEGAVDIEERLT
jgi:hypothetical protein